MGQYYHVITEDKNGKREYFNVQNLKWLESKKQGSPNYNYYNGLKLMEHSWWRNDFTTALAERLVDNPKKVCWVGDYAEEDECAALGFTYDEVWDREDEDYIYVEDTKFKMNSAKYLINNSKKTYVDLKDYYKKSKSTEEWKGKKYTMCIFPISLLTALGNDRGGGDYHEGGTCFEDVGTWAFDEIYLSNELPDGYEKLDVFFKES